MQGKHTNERAPVLSSPSEVIIVLNMTEKTKQKQNKQNKVKSKTQHETSLSKKQKPRQIRITRGPPVDSVNHRLLPNIS